MSSTNPFEGKTVCFTGTLKSQTRAQASSAATAVGATVVSSVSYDTNIVVCAPKAGSKKQQAKDKGCTIWSEAKFVSNLAAAYAAMSGALGATTGGTATNTDDEGDAAVVTPPTTPDRKVAAKKKNESPEECATKKKAKPNPTPGRRVMKAVSTPEAFVVYQDYDVKLMYSELVSMNSNKFYRLQLLRDVEEIDSFYVATNWGRLGDQGQHQLKGPNNEEKAIKEFCKVFRSKTKNDFNDTFVRCEGKYQLIDTIVDGDEETDIQPLGRLLPVQIIQGQEVLRDLRAILESAQTEADGDGEHTTRSGRTSRKPAPRNEREVARLTGIYYSLIPTRNGWDRLPLLDSLDAVAEKEAILEFMMDLAGPSKE